MMNIDPKYPIVNPRAIDPKMITAAANKIFIMIFKAYVIF